MGTSGSVYRPSQQEARYGLEECLVRCANNFAFSLYKELCTLENNFVCSPYCVNILLSLLSSGAGGDTALELMNVLGYSDVPVHEMHESFQKKIRELGNTSEGINLGIANSFWIQEGLNPKQSFKDIATGTFLADQREVDFRNRSPEVTTEINEWGRVSSQGVIDRLLSQEVDPKSIMVLLNAVYFNARWDQAFKPKITNDNFFNNGSEENPSMVRFIHQRGTFKYSRHDKPNAQILLMKYAGGCMTIVFFLPKNPAQLQEIEKSLSYDTFLFILSRCNDTVVDVTIPTFDLSSDLNLIPNIQNLGIHSIFKPSATLSGIAEGAMVNSVIHKVFLKVTEEGNISAAPGEATAQGPVEHFRADRPFGFFIVDHRTDVIIFAGRVVTIPTN